MTPRRRDRLASPCPDAGRMFVRAFSRLAGACLFFAAAAFAQEDAAAPQIVLRMQTLPHPTRTDISSQIAREIVRRRAQEPLRYGELRTEPGRPVAPIGRSARQGIKRVPEQR